MQDWFTRIPKLAGILVSPLVGLSVLASATQGLESRPILSATLAEQASATCVDLAIAEGWRMSISVVDDAGNLLFFRRMDGAFTRSIEISRLKAETAATVPFSTLELRQHVYDNRPFPHGVEMVPGIVVFEGGEQIISSSGVKLGGIGVSGSSSENDGRCARAALEAIAAEL
ncbi:MAG: heme-binding protein [Cyanobacteria bacterium J06626_14]